ncbi:glycosyltransferase family 4 protein [Microbulbifer hainanensis]|uniref:glycosyltransferase family 4 protein n=1 Tax=Microbulbifer hainanensis TaxID=2735675 RepID=UPI00186624F9|nr:glycosyltransferase family 4 protein [Microbulbifer hainanensis]
MNKVMFVSHGHPKFMKGGAEVASWNLFNSLKSSGYECLYVARSNTIPTEGEPFSSLNADEILFHSSIKDWFNLSAADTRILTDCFESITKEFNPDIIHVHHYAHIGIEIFPILKRAAPNAKIVFTVHEYMAICLHNGQMVKSGTFELCSEAVGADCHRCFPQYSASDFFLRKQYIQDQFRKVDHFISPSAFLAKRYIEWGVPATSFSVIENVLIEQEKLTPRPSENHELRSKFAFFGQINPYKGVDVLLEALLQLPANVREKVSLDIHGANLDHQTGEFKDKILRMVAKLEGTVTLRGQYEPHQLQSLMRETDWVIIPSVWWENSPVVIQEAISYGRPLIGSNIGGMKEKIENKAGLTFEARNPSALASAIQDAVNPEVFDFWHAKTGTKSDAFGQHLDLIENLLVDAN